MDRIDIKFLADKPDAVPLIAQWYFDEWGHKMKDNSVEKIRQRIEGMLNRDKIPLHVLGVKRNEVLGVAQLKIREMDIYPEKEHWLGGVYVVRGARGNGLASRLILKALELAKVFKVEKLYLQTERLDGGLYARLGWQPIEKVHYNGLHVLIMEKIL
jgi:predicted GNAT family N-acyltransferase